MTPHRNVPYLPSRRTSSSHVSSATSSPTRPTESQVEVLYNSAVQSFVRKDHVKTQATLSRLLELVVQSWRTKPPHPQWYDCQETSSEGANGITNGVDGINIRKEEQWLIKTLKLYISSMASLYSDPPANTSSLSSELAQLLPPSSPNRLLEHTFDLCRSSVGPSEPQINGHGSESTGQGPSTLLPPQLVSTLILASLKLRPSATSRSWASGMTENWLGELPDTFLAEIVSRNKTKDTTRQKQVEGSREAYLKVIELYVGELLARQGEVEMARSFLEGVNIMGTKRKEELYRHLRSMQTRRSNVSSPANSGILPSLGPSPSSSGILPSQETTSPPSPSPKRQRPRSSSTSSASSSSSERTARPVGSQLPMSSTRLANLSSGSNAEVGASGSVEMVRDRKGKGKAVPSITATGSTAESVPDRIELNHWDGPRRAKRADQQDARSGILRLPRMAEEWLDTTLQLLPPSLRDRLRGISTYRLLLGTGTFIPLILLFLGIWALRRRRRDRLAAVNAQAAAGVGAVTATAAAGAPMADVRARLEQVRRRGVLRFLWAVLRWWARKFLGVWQLATTITYF